MAGGAWRGRGAGRRPWGAWRIAAGALFWMGALCTGGAAQSPEIVKQQSDPALRPKPDALTIRRLVDRGVRLARRARAQLQGETTAEGLRDVGDTVFLAYFHLRSADHSVEDRIDGQKGPKDPRLARLYSGLHQARLTILPAAEGLVKAREYDAREVEEYSERLARGIQMIEQVHYLLP